MNPTSGSPGDHDRLFAAWLQALQGEFKSQLIRKSIELALAKIAPPAPAA